MSVRSLLQALRDRRWLLSPKKARFGYTSLHILGHVIEAGKIKPDEKKIDAIRRLLPPTSVK